MQQEQSQDEAAKEQGLKQQHDAESGNDNQDTIYEKSPNEQMIDPGNEHHHHDAGNLDRPAKHDADAGADATGTAGPEPGESENDLPDTTGEAGLG